MAAIMVRDAEVGYERGTAMANSVYVFALRDGTGDQAGTLLPWLARMPSTCGVPEQLPEPHPLPSARQVVEVLVAAGCHGTLQPPVAGVAAEQLVCPDPSGCPGPDVREIALHTDGEVLTADSPVGFLGLRGGAAPEALVAACALAAVSGPWVVYDGDCAACVVQPGDRPDALAAEWDWTGAGRR